MDWDDAVPDWGAEEPTRSLARIRVGARVDPELCFAGNLRAAVLERQGALLLLCAQALFARSILDDEFEQAVMALARRAPSSDHLCRTGKDEIAILVLGDTDEDSLRDLAARMRAVVQGLDSTWTVRSGWVALERAEGSVERAQRMARSAAEAPWGDVPLRVLSLRGR
jgi:hypothetical protein